MHSNIKISYLLTMLFALFISSCQNQEPEVEKESVFPAVLSSEATDLTKYTDLRQQHTNGRNIMQAFDLSNATTVTYEGIDDMEFIFAPHYANVNVFTVFAAKNGQTRQLPMQFENTANSLIISSNSGSAEYVFDENILTEVNISSTGEFGRTENCFATGFLDCGNRLQDELRAVAGDTGAWIIEGACLLFVWCRASVTITCAVGGIANCDLFTD